MRKLVRLVLTGLPLVVSLLAGLRNETLGQVMSDPSLAVTAVVTGLQSPTTMAFVAPNEFLVLEKETGRVLHVRDGVVVGTAIDLAVNASHERGALGIALHPGFNSNHFVYIFWTWKGSGTGKGRLQGSDSSDLLMVPERGNRIDRFVWNGSTLTFDRNILRLAARGSDHHVGGVLCFGPDRKLYVFVGDQNVRGQLQNVGSGPAPTNLNFTGVILRLNASGTAPGTNPFFAVGQARGGQAGENIKRIFAYGVRNSFGMAFDPVAGNLWIQENGDDAFDELDLVPPGFNSRWVQSMGPGSRHAQYRSIEVASGELDSPSFLPTSLAPTFAQAQASLVDLGGSAPGDPAFSWKFPLGLAGLGFLSSGNLGPGYQGDLFVGDVLTGRLFRFDLDAARTGFTSSDPRLADGVADNVARGGLTESETLIAGSGFGVVTDVETGPNGNLYVVSLTRNAVYQISAAP
ncbi:MAG TPA: PQQ-dependent sugar dehydrogenase [Gemmatimonadota bacterium]